MHAQSPTDLGRGARRETSYRETPLGRSIVRYLQIKGNKLSDASFRGYEACLCELALYYDTLELTDFEPPRGTELLEEFLADRWGHRSARTYNKNISILADFFRWHAARHGIHGDPTLPIEKAKKEPFHRITFTEEQCAAIVAVARGPRERIALRLLLNYGIRKGTLQRIRLMHFNEDRRLVTLYTKGNKIQTLPIPQQVIWDDLAEIEGEPQHYLMPRQRRIVRPTEVVRAEKLRARIADLQAELADAEERSETVELYPAEAIGEHGLHKQWYRWLERAGVVPEGVTSGTRLHFARHTAGQRILDKTGNLKAVQKTLGHASMTTTSEHYVDWDDVRLADTLREVLTA